MQNAFENFHDEEGQQQQQQQEPFPGQEEGEKQINEQQNKSLEDTIQQPRHPIAVFFHSFFRVAAFICTVVFFWVWGDNFVVIFIIVVTLLALDFWTIKNVTGRILVGLRWWNQINPDGTNRWRFESIPTGKRRINSWESRYFWAILVIGPMAWIVLTLFGLFMPLVPWKWSWLLIIITAIVLNSINLGAYFACRKDANQIKSQAGSFIIQNAGNLFSK